MTTTITRQRKTPQQRAEEQLAVADRTVTRLTNKRSKLRDQVAEITRELEDATARRDYLAKSPDLPHQPTTTTTSEDPA